MPPKAGPANNLFVSGPDADLDASVSGLVVAGCRDAAAFSAADMETAIAQLAIANVQTTVNLLAVEDLKKIAVASYGGAPDWEKVSRSVILAAVALVGHFGGSP